MVLVRGAFALGVRPPPKIVSEMLGHSSMNITLDLYWDATPTMQRLQQPMLSSLAVIWPSNGDRVARLPS